MADKYTLPGLQFISRGGGAETASITRMFESSFKADKPIRSKFSGSGWHFPIQFVGVRFRTSQRFNRALRYLEDQFPGQIERITAEIHENLALTVIDDARRHYRDAQRANRRPGATGRLMRFLTNPGEYEKIMSWTPRKVNVNFDIMNSYIRNERGFPYWQSVNYGYGPFEVEGGALFLTQAGRFAYPNRGSAKRDPKLLQRISRGAQIRIKFEGYGFVQHAVESMRSGARAEYTSRLKEELGQIQGVDALRFTRFFLGGGGVNVNAGMLTGKATGRFVGPISDFS